MRFLNIRMSAEHSKVNKIVTAIIRDIEKGILVKGNQLPSISVYSKQQKVSRDTVDKAYQQLKVLGYLSSLPGLGFFINNIKPVKFRILLVLNSLEAGSNIFYSSLLNGLGRNAKIDVRCHQSDAKILNEIISDSLGKYHYYMIEPQHFQRLQKTNLHAVLESIPARELVLLNKNAIKKSKDYISIFYGGNNSIAGALSGLIVPINKYRNTNLVYSSAKDQLTCIVQEMQKYSRAHKKIFKVIKNTERDLLQPSTLYIVQEDRVLVAILQLIRHSRYRIGQDIGVISLGGDSVFKELLDVSVIATDFEELGKSVAQMILVKKYGQIQHSYKITMRGSA